MKTLITTFTFLTLLFSASAHAEHPNHNHDHEAGNTAIIQADPDEVVCEDVINVKVNGLVCDFCARALEKVFSKRDEVAGIKVDLDNGLVKVAMKSGQTIDDDTLTQLITDSGYNVTAIEKEC